MMWHKSLLSYFISRKRNLRYAEQNIFFGILVQYILHLLFTAKAENMFSKEDIVPSILNHSMKNDESFKRDKTRQCLFTWKL